MSELKGAYRSKENELNYLTFSQSKSIMKCARSFMKEFALKQAGLPVEVPHNLQQAFDTGSGVEACLVGGTQGLADCFKGEEHKLWKAPTKTAMAEYEYYQKALRWKAGDETIRKNKKLEEVANGSVVIKPETTKSKLWQDCVRYTEVLNSCPDVKWMVENCQHSEILLSEFGGVNYKSELDFSSTKHNTIVDLKTNKNPFAKFWIERRGVKPHYGDFTEYYSYDLQSYIYRKAWALKYGVEPKYYIVVIGKSDHAPIEIIDMSSTDNDDYFKEILDTQSMKWHLAKLEVAELVKKYQAGDLMIEDKYITAQGCGKCDDCRSNKVPTFKSAVMPNSLWN